MSERMSKIQIKSNMVYESIEEWNAEAIARFGQDPLDWKFVCPACMHVQSIRDYVDAGAPAGAFAFSCVGRYLGACDEAFSGKGPCSYAGGGLFRLNPVTVKTPNGPQTMFAFAEGAPS